MSSHRYLALLPVVLLLVVAIALVPPALATVPQAPPGPRINLLRASFDPLSEQPPVAAGLAAQPQTRPGRPTYALVQFGGPIRPEWKQAAGANGAELLDYIPDYAFVARLQPGAAAALQALPFVRWVGPYHPAYKLSPGLDRLLARGEEQLQVRVRLFPGEDAAAVERALVASGAKVMARSAQPKGGNLSLHLPAAALAAVAREPAVAWVEPAPKFELANDMGRDVMGVHTAWGRVPGLYGAGQVIAIADTGLDTGILGTISADFRGRVAAAYALGRTDDWSDDDGHGTHVAGSALGSGSLSGSQPLNDSYESSFAGVAPEAGLVMQSVLDSGGGLGGLPADLNVLFGQAYGDGARVHSDSWGDPTTVGRYTTDAHNADLFAWNHKDVTILFAAGNEGTDRNINGVVDTGSVTPPGTAKNVVTVGASESYRPSGGYTLPYGDCYSWSSCWPADYPRLPLSIDALSNNVSGMAAFSSRGPTADGRIKPDVVAPGTNIISGRSHDPAAKTGWGEYDGDYVYMGGTSMATPLTAGAAALVRQWYAEQHGLTNPSGALVKATLINGTTDIAPGQYGGGSVQEVPVTTPNNVAGWGRINVAGAIAPDGTTPVQFDEHADGLDTGDLVVYHFAIESEVAPAAKRAAAGELTFDPPLPRPAAPTGKPESRPFRMPEVIDLPSGGLPLASMAAAGTEMVTNGGFETGSFAPWGYNEDDTAAISHYRPHGGGHSARLTYRDDQLGRIYQALAFPGDIISATLTFWLRADSTEAWLGYDVFWAGFYNTSDGFLAIPLGLVDAVFTPSGWGRVTYAFDDQGIAALRGESYYLLFGAQTDSSLGTDFYVDDVSLVYDIAAPSAGRPFRVTLAWTDYPAAEAARQALVNDLDLEVVAPDGMHYYGNNASSMGDHRNNVESVRLDGVPAGTWHVAVRAANVPHGPQPYALVAYGGEQIWPSYNSYLPDVTR